MFGHATNIFGHALILATFWPRERPASTRCQFYAEPAKIVILAAFWPPLCFIAAGVRGSRADLPPVYRWAAAGYRRLTAFIIVF